MSVHIKTPTKTQFEHVQHPCGESESTGTFPIVGGASDLLPSHIDADRNLSFGLSESGALSASALPQKRKFRERGGSFHMGSRKKQGRFHGKTGDRNVLPSKFLLGGNITDPLNLNALYHDEFGKILNEKTPQSSPLPLPEYKQEVQVLIPPNINDPLNLNAEEEADTSLTSPKYGNRKKKHKHNRKRRSTELANPQGNETHQTTTVRPEDLDLHTPGLAGDTSENSSRSEDTLAAKLGTVVDKVVSPVIPQHPGKAPIKPSTSEQSKAELPAEVPRKTTSSAEQHENKHQIHQGNRSRRNSQPGTSRPQQQAKNQKRFGNKFVYGNYDRYYGYRNPGEDVDNRLTYFRDEWFTGKDVLDIGCNIGHITLTVARDLKPKRIQGVDIDGKLISIAKKNIRHYMSNTLTGGKKFPLSIAREPIAAPSIPSASKLHEFPNNVLFAQGNYILDSDEELEMVQEEYDTILALSLTKWLHLNFGDAGLKRAFKRMHKQLRPGGHLILEPQPWSSYKKKKKLTPEISKNFQTIRFRPDQFTEFLLSREVGFIACEHLESPFNKSQGFQRPLQVYTKSESHTTPTEGVTPLMEIVCTPCNTPQLSAGTPYAEPGGTPYLESAVNTPPMFDVS